METNEKMSIKTPLIYPKVSFLDPVNTFSVDRFQTACGSADIISHVMEDYFGPEEDLYLLDRMMESVIKTVVEFAPVALDEPDNYEARANLMWASSWAINGFFDGSKKHRWACHAMEHELSAFYDVTHGLGLAIVKHILEAHQQTIAVESTYLSGTKFKFKLTKSTPSIKKINGISIGNSIPGKAQNL